MLSDYTFAVRDNATDKLVNIGKAYVGPRQRLALVAVGENRLTPNGGGDVAADDRARGYPGSVRLAVLPAVEVERAWRHKGISCSSRYQLYPLDTPHPTAHTADSHVIQGGMGKERICQHRWC